MSKPNIVDTTSSIWKAMAINKLLTLQLSQDYPIPLFYGADFIDNQENFKPNPEDQIEKKNAISLPEEITMLSSGEILCYRVVVRNYSYFPIALTNVYAPAKLES